MILDVFVHYFLLGLNQSEGSYHILQFLAPSQYLVKFVFANCNRETNQIVEFFHPRCLLIHWINHYNFLQADRYTAKAEAAIPVFGERVHASSTI